MTKETVKDGCISDRMVKKELSDEWQLGRELKEVEELPAKEIW